MKKPYFLYFLFVCVLANINVKSQQLSNAVRNDFCRNAIFNFYYGSNNFRSWMVLSGRNLGINTPQQITNSVRNICKNIPLQEEFFKNINNLGGSKDFKEQQYISIGMKPINAKILNDYVYLKYNNIQRQPEEETKSLLENQAPKDSMNIPNEYLLQTIFPKGRILENNLIQHEENSIDISTGKNVIIKYLTKVKDRLYYYDNDENIVTFIILESYTPSQNINKKNIKILRFEDFGKGYSIKGQRNRIIETEDITYKILYDPIYKECFVIEYINMKNEKITEYYDLHLYKLLITKISAV
ncbi:hypothetical protein [Elizabethkingia anophelis]|uniref:hypothetical protein n=1 Tax=Elizabethkingia anophelis TaxID=1117645 RepID=UPI00137159E3|nr:hypothetical protein [Elizabethkingia anophelis]MYY28995.1 hypothetical protein [Elizabethkingia anophelis]